MMAPERNCRGARAVKVPIVRGVRESLQTIPIVLPKKTKIKVTDFMKCRWFAKFYNLGPTRNSHLLQYTLHLPLLCKQIHKCSS